MSEWNEAEIGTPYIDSVNKILKIKVKYKREYKYIDILVLRKNIKEDIFYIDRFTEVPDISKYEKVCNIIKSISVDGSKIEYTQDIDITLKTEDRTDILDTFKNEDKAWSSFREMQD